jgi:hypothetical protein
LFPAGFEHYLQQAHHLAIVHPFGHLRQQRVGREATVCATARLFACASRRSTLNNSSRIGRSPSHGDPFQENPRNLTMSASAEWASAARRIVGPETIATLSTVVERTRHLADESDHVARRPPRARPFSYRPRFGKALPDAFGRKDHTRPLTATGALGNYLRGESHSRQRSADAGDIGIYSTPILRAPSSPSTLT